ncbi:MAG: RHS repeat-associated core domain-containing protein [Nitrospira sp.]|nr:RHS repeat-associated core domain-containing protein [Nitrospira sp.]
MSLNPSLYATLSASGDPTQVTAQYVWGARPGHRDELVLRDRDTDGNGSLDQRLYCLMDYFNPTAVIDTAGDVQERYRYTAFGLRTVMDEDWAPIPVSAVDFDFGFHGQFLDTETGYYNYGYRFYSPEMGRWLSRDPIGEKGGFNLLEFSANSPANQNDHFGLDLTPYTGSAPFDESSVRPEGEAENVDGHTTAEDDTKFWIEQNENGKCTLKGTGKLTVKIQIYRGVDTSYRDRYGLNVYEHERYHEAINAHDWNVFVEYVNSKLLGGYDNRKCAEIAQRIAYIRLAVNIHEIAIEHGTFDINAYGSSAVDISRMRELLNKAQRDLANVENEFTANNC